MTFQLHRREFLRISGGSAAGMLVTGGFEVLAAETGSVAREQKDLIVHGKTPHNAEPSLNKLVASWITPTKYFYVRSHAPAPKIDAGQFRLSVEGMVHQPFEVTLKELQQGFKKQTVVVTMTCAGNRRNEHHLVKKVNGVLWQAGAIGNASWGGARLSELLKKAGVKESAKHVWFEGADAIKRDSGIIPFGGSIPLEKALADSDSMPGGLVAYEMNGQPLLRDHGFPLRTVVPGMIGARSVKWLGKIILSDRPSTNHYLAKAYKLVTKGGDREWNSAKPIYNFPVNSVTCSPSSGARLKAGVINVRGYALAPGVPGRTVAMVEISTDGGEKWTKAKFITPAKPFCWRLWSANISLTRSRELIVRATDSAGVVQPEKVDWNLKGYLFNAWHRTPVQIQS